MARHRNYRNYAYEDDMSDDVYGHSVEDYDMAVSPTTAHEFMFRRSNSRDPNLSAYMADRFDRVEEEDEESEEEPFASSQDYRRPQLDPASEAKLSSCLDQLHSILGEHLHEATAVTALLQNNFDTERALDHILNQGGKQDLKANLHPFGNEGSICYETKSAVKNVKPSGQNSQCLKEGMTQLSSVENLNCTSTETAMSALPSTTFNQGVSADNSLTILGGLSSPDSVLSRPQHPLPPLSEINPDTNPVVAAPLDTKAISSLHSGMVSENQHLSLSHGCLSQTVGLQSQQTKSSLPSEPSQTAMSNQISLLSTPLSSLTQSGGLLSGSPAMSLPLNLFQVPSQHFAPSASLGSLSSQVGSSPPLLSYKPVQSPSSFSSSLLSAPLSSLSQVTTSIHDAFALQPTNHQDSLLSASLSSLSQCVNVSMGQSSTSSLPSSPSVSMESQTSEGLESLRSSLSRATEVPLTGAHRRGGINDSDTAHSLCQLKLQDIKIAADESKSNTEERDYNQNHKAGHKPSPIIVSVPNSEGRQLLYAGDKKSLATPAKYSAKKYEDQEGQLIPTCDNATVLTAKPTMFALALCYSAHESKKLSLSNKTDSQNIINKLYDVSCAGITPFDFCSLSPDDVVNEKQKGAFSRKK